MGVLGKVLMEEAGGGGKKRRGRLMGHEFDSCESLTNSSIIQNLNLQLGLVINLSKNNKKFKLNQKGLDIFSLPSVSCPMSCT